MFIVFGKVEFWNKDYIWFSVAKVNTYWVHRVFLSLRYACGGFKSTGILYFLCMGFHERLIRVYLYWGKFLTVFSSFDFDVRYFASR